MTKALFINGSPRKNGNTAQLLKRAMEGAREAGAECMSCFACKITPNYCGYPSAALRAFIERMEFPAVNYSDYSKPVVLKRIHSATIYTMNCPNEEVYRQMNYHILMDCSASQLGVFGPTEILCSYDTYQFPNYDRFDAATFDESHKAEVRDTQFPVDLEKAYELGKHLVDSAKAEASTP